MVRKQIFLFNMYEKYDKINGKEENYENKNFNGFNNCF